MKQKKAPGPWRRQIEELGVSLLLNTIKCHILCDMGETKKLREHRIQYALKQAQNPEECWKAGSGFKGGVDGDGFSSWGFDAPVVGPKMVPKKFYLEPHMVEAYLHYLKTKGRHLEFDFLLEGETNLWGGRVWDVKAKKEIAKTRWKTSNLECLAACCMRAVINTVDQNDFDRWMKKKFGC